ncbi:tripartite tricarboxylate transporter TctB family protein [Chelativorans sp. YIM 93263]|uniref:tripartite tricarboxylate transporter TctB family protein n=1 Tax=Chelativorans sp. YIM 93263 TaxID=2906648 RepID=UPI0023797D91|nr:tripartite tricarboxylate transporter TctB family protein [Chelativorans sp. YIM 93263]
MSLSKPLLSGLIFLSLGGFMIAHATGLRLGTVSAMGPGFFPMVIGILMCLVSAVFLGQACTSKHPAVGTISVASVRPLLLVITALGAFAISIDKFGLILSTVLLVTISRFAGDERLGWLPTAVLAAVLSAFVGYLFWYVLKLPLQLWP